MRPALATIPYTVVISCFHPNGRSPFCLKFKRALHKSPVPLIFNKCYRVQPFRAQVEFVATPERPSSIKAGGISIMGEIGQEDNILVNQVGIMEMGLVLPATQIHVEKAVKALKDGQVIAVPTDTLYGLAGDAWAFEAILSIFRKYMYALGPDLNARLNSAYGPSTGPTDTIFNHLGSWILFCKTINRPY